MIHSWYRKFIVLGFLLLYKNPPHTTVYLKQQYIILSRGFEGWRASAFSWVALTWGVSVKCHWVWKHLRIPSLAHLGWDGRKDECWRSTFLLSQPGLYHSVPVSGWARLASKYWRKTSRDSYDIALEVSWGHFCCILLIRRGQLVFEEKKTDGCEVWEA